MVHTAKFTVNARVFILRTEICFLLSYSYRGGGAITFSFEVIFAWPWRDTFGHRVA
ncbi:MAG: hypothetical protein HKP19_10735 [Xanthomonadales bacterium]|nr:hypothetical protein [Xanthomonadales bacterium]